MSLKKFSLATVIILAIAISSLLLLSVLSIALLGLIQNFLPLHITSESKTTLFLFFSVNFLFALIGIPFGHIVSILAEKLLHARTHRLVPELISDAFYLVLLYALCKFADSLFTSVTIEDTLSTFLMACIVYIVIKSIELFSKTANKKTSVPTG